MFIFGWVWSMYEVKALAISSVKIAPSLFNPGAGRLINGNAGSVMVPYPANADTGFQGPAQPILSHDPEATQN